MLVEEIDKSQNVIREGSDVVSLEEYSSLFGRGFREVHLSTTLYSVFVLSEKGLIYCPKAKVGFLECSMRLNILMSVVDGGGLILGVK